MSVIAKVYVGGVEPKYKAYRIEASCVAESALMAKCGAAPEDEDILFTTASPSGQLRAEFRDDPALVAQDTLYVIFTQSPQPQAWAWRKARIASLTDFGGTSRQVNITAIREYGRLADSYEDGEMLDFNFSIMIDNPGAYNQFTPGDEKWFVGLYRTSQVSMKQALALAHGANNETEDKSNG